MNAIAKMINVIAEKMYVIIKIINNYDKNELGYKDMNAMAEMTITMMMM